MHFIFDKVLSHLTVFVLHKVSKLFADASAVAITAFISPYRADRDLARSVHGKDNVPFVEVFVDAPLSVVEARDPKGLYKKARAGDIKGMFQNYTSLASRRSLTLHNTPDFTGISAPYEEPEMPEIHIRTDQNDVTQSVEIITQYLTDKGYI